MGYQGRRLTNEQKENIVSLFNDGDRPLTIATKVGFSTITIMKILRMNNLIDEDNVRRTYTLNDNAFSTLTPESEYWIGFVLADGSITSNRNLAIGLNNIDIQHLEKFQSFLCMNKNRIKPSSIPNFSMLVIQSKQIIEDLNKYGIYKSKSYLQTVLSDDIKFSPALWLGAIDGDGSIGLHANSNKDKCLYIQLVGPKSLMNQFADFCRTIVSIRNNGPSVVRHQDNLYRIRVYGKNASSVLDAMYSYSSVSLDRKREKYLALRG